MMSLPMLRKVFQIRLLGRLGAASCAESSEFVEGHHQWQIHGLKYQQGAISVSDMCMNPLHCRVRTPFGRRLPTVDGASDGESQD